jgi:tetratricopeptide (TPR) repeat protein
VFRASLEWFKFALEHGGDAMIAHGLAHSLRELGMYRETEEVSYAWREPLINNTILFIDILERDLTKEIPPYIEPERLQRYAQVTMDLSSGEGAQGLAWYAYNTCQYDVAYEWFQRANAWSPKEATAYGLAVLTRKLGKSREFVDLVNRYDGLFPKVVELLFPDNMYHPPSPCDLLLASEKDRQRLLNQAMMNAAATAPVDPSYAAARQAGYAVAQSPAGAIAPQTQPGFQQAAVAPAGPLAPAQQGYPVQQAYPQGYGARYDQPPKINRAEFPVSVNPENSLRYSSTGKLMGAVAPLGKAPPPQNPVAANEPWRGVQPLVARRVPGVGAMPYEHYGFSLLPGWTGVLTASAPHTAETAPAGTLWTTLQAKDAQSTRGGTFGTDAMRQDPAGLMRMIAGAPRVPPPTAVQIAPPQVRVSQTPINMSQAPPPIMTMASLAEPAPVGPPPPKVLDGARDDAAKYALELYKNGDYAGAVEALDRRGGVSIEPVDLRLVRAWSLMHLNRSEEARSIFASLDKKTGAGTASIMPKSYGAKPAAKAALAKPAAANAGAPTPPVRPKIAKASPAGNH